MSIAIQPQDVVRFWHEAGPDKWFAKDDDFDRAFIKGYQAAHMAAARRELDGWMDQAEGALALLILLDQFPRNAFRGTAHMFATDPLALAFARQAVARGHDRAVDAALRVFFYLPFEHSEAPADQEQAVALCAGLGDYGRYAGIHRDVIARFGRFPHRNAVLGRETTIEERTFLDDGGFSG
ncbi:DUF924 family protein [Rhodanobacter sp. DHG33]|uniref:DUF924 family protein n=1 Tax=Rhodanobacter sp. DHG33 TaxID=2775921 RepID=UPI00178684FE|nr:DUF924 family protein [Rhodanobacter sp. DHG33]MBD8900035.1 DUF924 family protein [Rhodanobacter sp. DHG33]